MRLLLDTHVLLWLLAGDPRLSSWSRERMVAADERLVSAVTAYEIGLKAAIGKLTIEADLDQTLDDFGLERLAVSWAHADHAARLPLHHRDPWDRLLVAQAALEGLTIVTAEPAIERYDVAVLPAGAQG